MEISQDRTTRVLSIDAKTEIENGEGKSLQFSGERKPDPSTAETPGKASTSTSSLPAISTPWTVSELPVVPMGMPLEPTSVRIQGLAIADITSRICAFMKGNSVGCVFHNREARVDCKTFCGRLKFIVQLWRKKETLDDYDDDGEEAEKESDQKDDVCSLTILEVQRRRGCCIVMRAVRKMLYQAVTKNATVGGLVQQASSLVDRRRSMCLRSKLFSIPRRPVPTTDAVLWDFLDSPKRECHRYGMEMLLLLLVNRNVVVGGVDQAEAIAQALVFGTGDLGQKLRTAFVSMPAFSCPHETKFIVEDVFDVSLLECPSPAEADEQSLRLLALKVLSSCLEIIVEKEQDYLCNEAVTMLDLSSNFWSTILSYLLYQMDNCAQRQHEAALSAKCFRILELLQPGLMILATDSMVVSKAIKAYKCGRKQHLFLEQESEKLLQSLKVMKDDSTLKAIFYFTNRTASHKASTKALVTPSPPKTKDQTQQGPTFYKQP